MTHVPSLCFLTTSLSRRVLLGLAPSPDAECLIRVPRHPDPLATGLERFRCGRLEVLAHRDELAAPVELDTVARDDAEVEHLLDDPVLDMSARTELAQRRRARDALSPV